MKTQLFTDKTERHTTEFNKPSRHLGFEYCFRIINGDTVYTTAWRFDSLDNINKKRDEQQRLFNGCEVEIVR